MKNDHKAETELGKLKKRLPELRQQAAKTRDGKLWQLEAVVRGRLRVLNTLPSGLKGYSTVREGYSALFDDISQRLLAHYNQTRRTDYRYEEVIAGNEAAYRRAGLISVLLTAHIPRLIAADFKRLLPDDPKDGYPLARKLKRKFFLHLGETNTGKTYNALQRLKESDSGVYLSPLRILALENFERLNDEGYPCSLLTGEEEIPVEGAWLSSRTVEKADLTQEYAVAVLDEVQLMGDAQRGDAWTRAILGLRCREIHLCGALTAKEQLLRMIANCGDDYELREYSRLVPLQTEKARVTLEQAQPGDAFVAFSRRAVLGLSRYFAGRGLGVSVIYGDLPPEVRRLQYAAFLSGLNPVLVSTDAIGMGVNLPIRRIVFTETQKFDGEEFRPLSSQELKQIAGRAGRLGIYEIGFVACTEDEMPFIESRLRARDEPVAQAVVGPSETLLEIGGLSLREKLALWSAREEPLAHYRKKDLRDYLLILDRLEAYRLPEAVQWRLMMLPFDVNSEALMEQFLRFVEDCFVRRAEALEKPVLYAQSLSQYEEFYRRVNLYYAFSKAMNLPLDEQWVYETRQEVSEEINALL